ncbi:MAG: hypothetical protein ACOX4O_07510 [Eubacteriales bacterium]
MYILFCSKKLLIKFNKKTEDNAHLTDVFNAVEQKFSNITDSHDSSTWQFHEKYADDASDFNTIAPTKGGISLTQSCQLSGKYFSFNSGECGNKSIELSQVRAFIDMLVKNVLKLRLESQKTSTLEISIAGGGEPTFDWEKLAEIAEYVKKTSCDNNIPYRLTVITNCCHTEEQTEYIIKNFSDATVLFDGLPELQNKNRSFANGKPSFELVDQTIRRFEHSDFRYSVLSVVDFEDFGRIKEMAQYVFSNYPNVYSYTVRPVIATGRAAERYDSMSFTNEYLSAVAQLGEPRRLSSGFYSHGFFETFSGAIYGAFPWLIPGGDIVTQDAHDNAVLIGRIQNDHVDFFSYHDIYAAKSFKKLSNCRYCIAYYHCLGDCPIKDMTEDMERYSFWKYSQVIKYWKKVFIKLIQRGAFAGLYLDRKNLENYEGVEVFEVRGYQS